jgi:hypothetical protein
MRISVALFLLSVAGCLPAQSEGETEAAISAAESVEGAALPHVASFVDASGNTWKLSSGTLMKNGAASQTKVTSAIFYEGAVYAESTSWTWTVLKNGAWVARNALGDPRVTSANGASSTSSVIDANRNVWQIVGGKVYESGALAGTVSGVTVLEYWGGTVYADKAGAWMSWNGTAWVAASNPSLGPVLPAAVSAVGYTDPVFLDDFGSLATIDMKNTKVPGFNWYIENASTGEIADAKSLSIESIGGRSVLRFDGSRTFLYGVQKYEGEAIGPVFEMKNGGGAYFEARIAYGTTSKQKEYPWPAFWATSRQHMANLPALWTGASAANYTHYLEYDFMEFFNDGTNEYTSTVIDWYGEWDVTCASTHLCSQNDPQWVGTGKAGQFASTESAPAFHKYGALWVPSLEENGAHKQGYFQWFLDGAPVAKEVPFTGPPPANDLVPATPWKYSVIDTEPLTLVLDTGSGAFMYVDYVGVWQKP